MHRTLERNWALWLLAIGASLIGLALLGRKETPTANSVSASPSPVAVPGVATPPVVAPNGSPLAASTPAANSGESLFLPGIPAIEGEAPMIPPITLQRGELAWEKQLRAVLEDATRTDREKAGALLGQLAALPAEGRETAAEEAVKRVANADYRVAQPHVTSAGTYGLALGVLFADLMERPDDLRLPTLLTIARNPQHPFAEAARDNLNLLLKVQHGTDWTQWDAAIRARLAGSR